MAARRPIAAIGGEQREVPNSDTLAASGVTFPQGLILRETSGNANQLEISNPNGPVTYIKATGSDGRTTTIAFNSNSLQLPSSRLESNLTGPASHFWATNVNGATNYFQLADDAVADVMSQRRSTNAQVFRLYNSFTSLTDYERVAFDWQSVAGVFQIKSEAAGAGTVRDIALMGGKVGIGKTNPACALDVEGTVRPKVYTVATLPSAALAPGCLAVVSDAQAQTSFGAVVGGGTLDVLVISDGATWNAYPTTGGVGGGANIGSATVDFGANDDTTATVTVTGQSWVGAGSIILCTPSGAATADHDPEDYVLEQISAVAINKVAGTGFDILVHAPEGTHGTYVINFMGV